MSDFGAKFGRLVRQKRAHRGMTQAELAQLVFGNDHRKSQIARLERGHTAHPTASTIARFSQALGISDQELDELALSPAAVQENTGKAARIFVSYCREDVDSARLVSSALEAAGLDVWVDFARLDGGQRWKSTVSEAIKSSDFFVALLSENAINKRGYVQKEIREALEVLQTIPEDQSFFLPCRLEECQPKNKELEELHWVDLFPDFDAGIKSLVRGIKNQYLTAFSSASMKREGQGSASSKPAEKSPRLQIQLSLTKNQQEAIQQLQEETGAESPTEVLRRALALLEVVEKERKRGSEVVLDRIDERIRLILPS